MMPSQANAEAPILQVTASRGFSRLMAAMSPPQNAMIASAAADQNPATLGRESLRSAKAQSTSPIVAAPAKAGENKPGYENDAAVINKAAAGAVMNTDGARAGMISEKSRSASSAQSARSSTDEFCVLGSTIGGYSVIGVDLEKAVGQ